MEIRFYICGHCGKVVTVLHESGVPVMCCGQKMQELVPGTSEGSAEKHLPVCTAEDGTVTVRVVSAAHPMTQEHFIEWIVLETKQGSQTKALRPGDAPEARFALVPGDEPVAAYAFCNQHRLWKQAFRAEEAAETRPQADASENYIVCKCNRVSYFDIVREIHRHESMDNLLKVFDAVRDTTRCSTGCGGCYDKVIDIISEEMMGGR